MQLNGVEIWILIIKKSWLSWKRPLMEIFSYYWDISLMYFWVFVLPPLHKFCPLLLMSYNRIMTVTWYLTVCLTQLGRKSSSILVFKYFKPNRKIFVSWNKITLSNYFAVQITCFLVTNYLAIDKTGFFHGISAFVRNPCSFRWADLWLNSRFACSISSRVHQDDFSLSAMHSFLILISSPVLQLFLSLPVWPCSGKIFFFFLSSKI